MQSTKLRLHWYRMLILLKTLSRSTLRLSPVSHVSVRYDKKKLNKVKSTHVEQNTSRRHKLCYKTGPEFK